MKQIYALLTLILIVQSPVYAQDGTLDPTFGDNGVVVETFFDENCEFNDLLKNLRIPLCCRVLTARCLFKNGRFKIRSQWQSRCFFWN